MWWQQLAREDQLSVTRVGRRVYCTPNKRSRMHADFLVNPGLKKSECVLPEISVSLDTNPYNAALSQAIRVSNKNQ